ncbi:hypothetical protein N7495_003937 [Penicillium taxi]|uniref:uncharacterized protein n=1 Tax=Penicillium taxi TaxID=168475 RepID=UPI0025456A95|nr:uncharacterized protein N7495_003937 [Penicillium taxi]KAJ5899193.1 hypothetical protein N7495_003937 [Penicillium taxi]
MDGIEIPDTGLFLRTGEQPGDASTKPAQIMRLNLVQSTLDELILTLRNDEPARVRLGKHPSLHYAGKSQSFHAYPETHRSEIYHLSTDKKSLYFTGVMSHSLEVEKAKKATAATDQALATLEESLKESLSAFERGKDAKKTTIMHHPDEFKGLRGNKARAPKTKADLERERVLRASANRSLNASPTLGASRSPIPPTSAPASQTKSNARLEALKMPFIHLLAVRAVSTKFLSRQTCSSIEDCASLAQKLGSENRLNREKFDLKDKSYKDLDVWKFPYPNQEDRQQAIENAVSAFDRMRISRTDKLWQMLLPKEERGKGKCLSRLNLSNGPIKKAAASRMQLDGVEDDAGHDIERAPGSGVTATKSNTATPRSNAAPKTRLEKEPAKRPTKSKPTTNSTLAGRVTKKTERKPPAKTESKIKSAEFVLDSDDDDDMLGAAPAPSQRSKEDLKPAPPKKAPASATAQKSPTKSQPLPKPLARDSFKSPKSEAPNPKLESSQPVKAASKRPPSRLSNSPQKPSPLGSSPPTNSSDVQGRNRSDSTNLSSSSSSSPLIAQLSRSSKPTTTAVARSQKPAVKTNGIAKSAPATNPLKRKAEPERLAQPAARTTANLEHKRRRAISASSGGSTGSASPPMSHELLRQQLRDKSQTFKKNYARYQSLHEVLAAQANPSQADLDRLQKQRKRLQTMKEEIWAEDQRLREGILS